MDEWQRSFVVDHRGSIIDERRRAGGNAHGPVAQVQRIRYDWRHVSMLALSWGNYQRSD
ncbi:hypothetical protein [Burkholderia mayonis]|uniref:hypothetical protein n=1 Tax=Burkholderia mayonis TaxID=1385591 RepID=UPI000A859B8D|nr:hypothetical protein [Burkholderia mayonis]